MKTYAKVLAVLILAAPSLVLAEPLPKPVSGMECLVGQWKGGGSLQMGKDNAKIHARWECQRTAAEFGVLCKFHVTGIPGVAAYEETDLMGYEPNTNTYHWYSVTNGGDTHDHVAAIPTGDALQFVFNGTQEGKPLREVIDLNFMDHRQALTGRVETFIAGASVSVMELELHK
jgi:hypothetical protein